ncbi:hypothetical protein [Saccharothrix coeruleofusca]|nr:hypothetical protein [Saccharothrix coeruleofusca]
MDDTAVDWLCGRMPPVLNVGLDPQVVGDPSAPNDAFPTVDAAQVEAGLARVGTELALLGLGFETCLLDRSTTAVVYDLNPR